MKYTVKKGDRLSEIAKQLGVKTSDITGYKSGNPDLIYPGETLTIGSGGSGGSDFFGLDDKSEGAIKDGKILDPTGNWRDVNTAGGEQYQLDRGAFKVKPFEDKLTDIKGDTSYGEYTSDYAKKRDEAFNALKGLREKEYDNAYKEKGLDKIKGHISDLDSKIQELRDARDTSILKTRQNPYLSASALAGDVSKLADKYNSQINNLIQERNAVAGEYNTTLGEINNEVNNALRDKEMELSYYGGLESDRLRQLNDLLNRKERQSEFERRLAQTRSGGKMSLVKDPYGQPLYWVDSSNQNIIPIETDTNLGGSSTYADMLENMRTQKEPESTFKWYNPLTWF